MKRIIVLIGFLISYSLAFSQTPKITQNLGAKNTDVNIKGKATIDSAVTLPKDTIKLFEKDTASLTYRNGELYLWRKISDILTWEPVILARNGLNKSGKYIELGGTVTKVTDLNLTGTTNSINIYGTTLSIPIFKVENTGAGSAISATAPGVGTGLRVIINNGTGVSASATGSGTAINGASSTGRGFSLGQFHPTSSNDVTTIGSFFKNTTGLPANGFGARIDYELQSNTVINQQAMRHIYRWSDANFATRSAEFELQLTNNAVLESKYLIRADGSQLWHGYAGTAQDIADATGYKTVVMDALGNIKKFNGSIGGGDIDLGWIPSTRTITNTGGNSAVLTDVNRTHSGLATPSMLQLDWISNAPQDDAEDDTTIVKLNDSTYQERTTRVYTTGDDLTVTKDHNANRRRYIVNLANTITVNSITSNSGSAFNLTSATGQDLFLRTNGTNRIGIGNGGGITFNTSSNSYTWPTTRGVAGQVPMDVNGNGTITWETPAGGGGGGMAIGGDVTSGTTNSLLFVNSSGDLAQDNANLNFVDGTNTLSVPNITAPSSSDMTIRALSPQKISFVTNSIERMAINNTGSIVFNEASNSISFPTVRPDYAGSVLTAGTAGTMSWQILFRTQSTATSASSVTPNLDASENWAFTALAANITINAPTSDFTVPDFKSFVLRLRDNGTARTITWNGVYVGTDIPLPTTTEIGITLWLQLVFNDATDKWCLLGQTKIDD